MPAKLDSLWHFAMDSVFDWVSDYSYDVCYLDCDCEIEFDRVKVIAID